MSTNFPITSIDTATTIGEGADNVSTTTDAEWSGAGNNLPVTATTGFPTTSGFVQVVGGGNTGVFKYLGLTAATSLNSTTYVSGTDTTYPSGSTVKLVPSWQLFKNVIDSVLALEAKVGIDSSAVAASHDKKIATAETDITALEAANTAKTSSARAYRDSNQSIGNATWTKVTLGSESWDTLTEFSSSRFTAAATGKYQVNGQVEFNAHVDGYHRLCAIYVNGVAVATGRDFTLSDYAPSAPSVSDILNLTAADYVELYCYQNKGGTALGSPSARLSIHRLS